MDVYRCSLWTTITLCISTVVYLLIVGFYTKSTYIMTRRYRETSSPQAFLKRSSFHQDFNSREPVKHIAFLKVHKAASTTVQNIFLRYGLENNLMFALPKFTTGINIKNTVHPDRLLPPPANRTYDIYCSHAKYNREAFENIMPSDTVYIGIVREPFSQFKSYLNYYRPKRILNIPSSRPVLEYILNWRKYSKNDDFPDSYNLMSHDMGFSEELLRSSDKADIERYLMKLDKELDFVIVTDYFDESMVLMRRILKWDLKYILYGNLNARKWRNQSLVLEEEEEKAYKKWAQVDYALYDFFLQKVLKQIREQPPDFQEELEFFKETKSKYQKFCLNINTNSSIDELIVKESAWNKPFVISKQYCKQAFRNEVKFINDIRLYQGYSKLPRSVH